MKPTKTSDLKKIPLNQIDYDPYYYPRVSGNVDWLTVVKYADSLKANPKLADPSYKKREPFPPVVLVRTVGKKFPYMLIDGLHRTRAFHEAGFDKISAYIIRAPESKWLAIAAEYGAISKRPLGSRDMAWVFKRLEKEGWSLEKVAGLLQVRPESLQKMVVKSVVKLEVDKTKPAEDTQLRISSTTARKPGNGKHKMINGDQYGFLKAPVSSAVGTSSALQALESQDSMSSHSAANVLDSAIGLVESGTLDYGDQAIAEKLHKLRILLVKACKKLPKP